ncbi:MAG: hypothetical protein KDK50_05130, partial [Chlamydiia bacterium]|nr:hypothetical protein [Chlamydiia bacterium]
MSITVFGIHNVSGTTWDEVKVALIDGNGNSVLLPSFKDLIPTDTVYRVEIPDSVLNQYRKIS